jgi:hypothetical protein
MTLKLDSNQNPEPRHVRAARKAIAAMLRHVSERFHSPGLPVVDAPELIEEIAAIFSEFDVASSFDAAQSEE